MASNMISSTAAYGSEPVSPNTTYVQADPSNFRAVVQKLTGAPDDQSTQKLPLTNLPSRFINSKPTSSEMGPRKPAFKLHERRQTAKKLELNLTTTASINNNNNPLSYSPSSLSPCGSFSRMAMVSPVTPLELLTRGSPRTPVSPSEEEEKAIAHKGFYLHPSPLSTPRGSDPPELLPLFPVLSPRDREYSSVSS